MPPTETWSVIVNPAAGGGRSGARAPQALELLRASGMTLAVTETESPGHATQLAREAWEAGSRHFLVVGGDGTGYEVVNGLFPQALESSEQPCLAFLPLGTGNSFLRDFGISSAEEAISALASNRRRRVDVVRARHSEGTIYYMNLLSIGFSAEVGALTNRRFKRFGPTGYTMAVFVCLAGLRHHVFPLRLDADESIDDRPNVLLSFSNSRFTGGTMMMAPAADPADGKLDVIRVGAMGRLSVMRTLPKLYKGTHVLHPRVEERQTRRVDFVGPSGGLDVTDVMVDGEVVKLALRDIEVIPGAMEVVA